MNEGETSTDLQVGMEEREGGKRRLTITVAPERVARERRRQLQRLAGSLKLPGFRKGKVPAQVVEDRFGPAVTERTLNAAVEWSLREAIRAEGLQPLGDPEVENLRYRPGEPLTFQVELEVLPGLRLQRTGGFRVKRPEVSVSEAEVDEVIERLREEQGVWEPAERAPEPGDLVSVRILNLDEEDPAGGADGSDEDAGPEAAPAAEGAGAATEKAGPAVEGAGPAGEPPGRPYRFELGEGYAIPQVEEAIRTLDPGASGEFEVRFPEDFDDPELAGSARRLRIALLEVKRRRLPEIDDRFASEVGDFDSLEALREAVREDLQAHKEEEAERTVRDRLLDSIIEANPFEVPPGLVERYLERMIEAPEDADPERVQAARRSLKPAAERQIKRQLVLDQLIEAEGLEATEAELEARIARAAETRGESPSALRGRLAREDRLADLRRQISVEKAFESLTSRSTVE